MKVRAKSTMSAHGAGMCSVITEAEPFESAAVASVVEHVATAGKLPASVVPVLATLTAWTAWLALAPQRRQQALQRPADEGLNDERLERAFDMRSFQ